MRPELGGGALLDVGCYGVDVVRWLLGEPDRVEAMAHGDPLDMTVTALLGFPSGARATVYASFESPDYQALTVVTGEESFQVDEPFTAWLDPHDPYQYMVEAFGDAVLDGEPAPLPPESSIANMKVLDRIRAAARESSSPRLGGGRWGA
jgi:predicted dehydrogenase